MLEIPERPPAGYDIQGKLGKGGFGVVYRAVKDESVVALKVLRANKRNEKQWQALASEIELLEELAHPSMTAMLGYGYEPNQGTVWIALEFCDRGSLGDKLRDSKKPLNSRYAAGVMYQLLVALRVVHAKGVVHRDIKADNILLRSDGEAKLANMGLGRRLEGNAKRHTVELSGSPYWLPPDFLSTQDYSFATDVWAVGVVLIELLECFPPLHGFLPMVAMFHVANDSKPFWFKNPHLHSVLAVDFVSRCLVRDPDRRASLDELIDHPLVRSVSCEADAKSLVRAYLDGNMPEPDFPRVEEPQLCGPDSKMAVEVPKDVVPIRQESFSSVAAPAADGDSDDVAVKESECDEESQSDDSDDAPEVKDTLAGEDRPVGGRFGGLFRRRSSTSVARRKTVSESTVKAATDTLIHQQQPHSVIETVHELVHEMSHPKTGVSVRNRLYRTRVYPRCFVAADAVNWMVERMNLPSRDQAVGLGILLQRRGYIYHVAYGHQFCDKRLFFRFEHHHVSAKAELPPEVSASLASLASAASINSIVDDPAAGATEANAPPAPSMAMPSGDSIETLPSDPVARLSALLAVDGDLLSRFGDAFRDAVSVADRSYHGRKYRQCFLGSEAVDWLRGPESRALLALPRSIEISRPTAVEIGRVLMRRGIFHHVVDRENFVDGKKFYRFFADEI